MELLPKVPLTHYRVRAVLRHERGSESRPECGPCVCYSDYPTTHGRLRLIPVLTYAEFGNHVDDYRDAHGRSALFHVWANFDAPLQVGDRQFQLTLPPRDAPIPPRLGAKGPFREITIEVDPEGLRGYWRDEATNPQRNCAHLSNSRLQRQLTRIRIQLRDVAGLDTNRLEIPRNGGIGVFCNDSTVAVKEFIIEPGAKKP